MPARLNKDKKVTGLRLLFRSPVFMRIFNWGPRKALAFWGKGERNGVFIVNFAKNSFKHGISFDVV